MRVSLVALLALACTEADPTADPIAPYDPLPLVDPFVGTDGLAAQVTGVTPAACAPLGMVRAGPNTRSTATGDPGFYHFSGYHYQDDRVEGFAHTHAYAMGINDYGGVHVMPRAAFDARHTRDRNRAAPFTHDREWASPGRYAVDLQDDGTHVEIVATPRGALHTWTFGAGAEPVAWFDLAHTLGDVRVEDASFSFDAESGAVEGFQRLVGGYSGRFGGLRTHFVAEFDPAPVGSGTWGPEIEPSAGSAACEGAGCAGWVAFAPGTTEVRMRLAVSYVDPEGAWANLREEHPDYDAEARLAEVEAAWRGLLSRVRVAGGTEDERVAFHTALYHSLIMPTRFTDVDGRYRGVDQAVHTADFDYLTDLSLWDTFRTLHPLWLLAWPEHQRSAIRSLIRMGEDGGALARWPLGHGYTGGMVGTPAQQVMAESYLKGLDGWDAEAAFDLAWPASIGPQVAASRGGVGEYVELGYVPVEDGGGSVSRTLEYAWSDHAMARWAEAMGREEEAAVAWTLADNWQGVWSDEWDFFIGRRRDGSFTWEEDVRFDWRSEYVEGNAWHYVWMMPQDVAGLIEVQHGGDRAAFLDRYRTYWQDVADEPDDGLPDDFYWHGNEPVMHYAFLGSLAGAPDLTADAARWVLANRYDATPLGLDGNDDSGTLSAWYALAAMGLFPVSGTEVYAVASPLFERSEIDREDGSMLVIRAPGASAAGRYVQRAWLGSEPLDRASLTHAEWVQAGEVILELGPERGAWAADGAAPAP